MKVLQKYQDKITEEIEKHGLKRKVQILEQELKRDDYDGKEFSIQLNKIDAEVTSIMLLAEKKCSNIHMLCRHDWSPELKFALLNLRHAKRHIRQIKQDQTLLEDDYCEKLKLAYENRRKWRRTCKEAKASSKELRESFLEELANHLAEQRETLAANELKQLLRYEEQRKKARRIRNVLKGKNRRLLTSIEIPDIDAYSINEKNITDFSHLNIQTIWNKLLVRNGSDVKTWERIDDRETLEKVIIEWQTLYFGQSKNTPLASKRWEEKLNNDEFQNEVLEDKISWENEEEERETIEFLHAMRRVKNVKEVPFVYSYQQFRNMIKKTKENKTASPSGRHWGHYKALIEMEDDTMLHIIFKIMNMLMKSGEILHRYSKVSITLLEKDTGSPKIHRLRPVCIVEAELNCIAKHHWSRELMKHVERENTITDDQYGGRRGRQAQSAVINKLMYYNIQHQIAEEAVFIDKDARSCFDRLIPQLVAIENTKLGSVRKAGKYMVDILDSQKLHFRTGHGLTEMCEFYVRRKSHRD